MDTLEEGQSIQEDRKLLVSFLPGNWQELAVEAGALKGLRKNKSAERLLRVLLLHFGCGHSLQETAWRARQAELAELSAVALGKRLKKSKAWLQALCRELFQERGIDLAAAGGLQMRAVDATTIKEPGKTGSLWRLHSSVRLPSLACDYFQLTATEGAGAGESFARIPVQAGDCLVADRGYSTAAGLGRVAAAGGLVTVRVNTGALRFSTVEDQTFDLLAAVRTVRRAGQARSWDVLAIDPQTRPCRGGSDTPQFAVDCIKAWWRTEGRARYPDATRLLILADSGGSNGCRARAWKHALQHTLCNPHQLRVTVAHDPSGCSQWNRSNTACSASSASTGPGDRSTASRRS